MSQPLIIGSRGSDLALWQANYIKDLLLKAGIESQITIIKTQGDKIQNLSFDKLEGKGFFTKELEDALLDNKIDLAVHSHKDLPTLSPEGLCIAAVSYREDPADVLLIQPDSIDAKQLLGIKKGATVGTSSFRRKMLLESLQPGLKIADLRGNVPTRIEKLRKGEYNAIVLAAAGVKRLGLDLGDFVVKPLETRMFVPAPAQGVLALQTRSSDAALIAQLQSIHQSKVQARIQVERSVLQKMEGGCLLPLGVFCNSETNDQDVTTFSVDVAWGQDGGMNGILVHYRSEHPEELPEKILSHLKSVKPCSVFVSRKDNPKSLLLQRLRSLGFQVHSEALIEMLPVAPRSIPETAWIFFSSKHAVRFFMALNPNIHGKKFGVIGKSTGDELRKFGARADFFGTSNDTTLIGKQFASRIGKDKVLFPIAKGSLRTIQKQFTKPEQAIDLVVYETIEVPLESMPLADIMVMTSPSNVQTLVNVPQKPVVKKWVAMGAATEAEIRKHFLHARIVQPDGFDDIGLLKAVLYQAGV
jgi:hydroxymethylbilane synthase